MTEQFSNGAISSLSAALTANATVLFVANPTAFPTQGNFRIVVQSFDATTQTPTSAAEIMLVTAVSGKQFTVTRAVEPIAGVQQAIAFASGAQVANILTAGVMANLSNGNAVWGNITGNINNQTDLQTEFNSLLAISVAFS